VVRICQSPIIPDFQINQGAIIGTSGNTGGVPCHLHFQAGIEGVSNDVFNALLFFSNDDTVDGTIQTLSLRQNGSIIFPNLQNNQVFNNALSAELVVLSNDLSNANRTVNWVQFKSSLDGLQLQSFTFLQLSGLPSDPADVYSVATPASSFSPFVTWYRMGNLTLIAGEHQLCLDGYDLNDELSRLSQETCLNIGLPSVPEVYIASNLGDLYNNVAGITDTPSSLETPTPGLFTFKVNNNPPDPNDAPAPLQSIFITDPNGNNIIPVLYDTTSISNTPLNPQPNPNNLAISSPPIVSALGGFTPVTPGQYNVTITDINNIQTVAPFVLATMGAAIDPASSAQYDPDTGYFNWSVTLDASASLGLDHITQYNESALGADGPIIQTDALIGQQDQDTFSSPTTTTSATLNWEIVDSQGNWINYFLSMSSNDVSSFLGPSNPDPVSLPFGFYMPPAGGEVNGSAAIETIPGTNVVGLTAQMSGSYTSPIFDLIQSSVMPGGIMRAGIWTDPSSQMTSTFSLTSTGFGLGPIMNGSIALGSPQVNVFNAQVSVLTGDQPGGTAETLFSGIITSGTFIFPPATVPVQRYFQLQVALVNAVPTDSIDPAYCLQVDDSVSPPVNCLQWQFPIPYLSSLGSSVHAFTTYSYEAPAVGMQFEPGPNQNSPVTNGVSVSNLNAVSSGTIYVNIGTQQADPGYMAVPQNVALNVSVTLDNGANPNGSPAVPFYTPPLTLNFDTSQLGLTAAQLANLQIVYVDPGLLSAPLPLTVNAASQTVSINVNPTGAGLTFMALAPIASTPVVTQNNGFTLTYDSNLNPTTISMSPATTSAQPLQGLLAQALARGLTPLGLIEQMTPVGNALYGATQLKAPYTPVAGIPIAGLYALTSGQPPLLLPGQFTKYMGNFVSANLLQTNSYFGVFGSTTPVPVLNPDTTPPVTHLVLTGESTSTLHGRIFVATNTLISFSAYDPVIPGAVTSGVATTYFLIDKPFISISSSPPCTSTSPFTLNFGSHTISYLSVDYAGNIEGLHVSSVTSLNDDITPPVTTLVVFGSSTTDNSGSIIISSITPIGFFAYDPRVSSDITSGVAVTYYAVDQSTVNLSTSSLSVYISSFTLPPGNQTVVYFSQDKAGNTEGYHVSNLIITTPQNNSPGNDAAQYSSTSTLAIAWSSNGNPPGTVYSILYATVPSANSCNANISNYSTVNVSTTSTFLTNLIPGAYYEIDVCNQSLISNSTQTSSGCDPPIIVETTQSGSSNDPSYTTCSSSGPTGPTIVPGSGLAINVDPSGNLWEVVQQNSDSFALESFNSNGSVMLSSISLHHAIASAGWSVRFDNAGNAYAVGQSSAGSLTDLLIYQVSPSGLLLSSTVFQSPQGANSLSFDSSGGLWITGALQTGTQGTNSARYTFALWHYNLQNQQIMVSTYSRGFGGDAGFGVQASSSLIWVAGYSAGTNSGLGGTTDLALWAFSMGSGALVKGPYFVPGVLPNGVQGNIGAKLDLVGGNLYTAALRQSGNSSQVGFYEFNQSGQLLLSQAWTPASGLPPIVNGIAHDNMGHIVAAGQLQTSSGTQLGVWSYSTNGSFIGAFTDPNAPGGAKGIVYSTNTYLAVSGSGSPYQFSFNTNLAGSNVILSSSSNSPPVTTLSFGTPSYSSAPYSYVAGATTFTLTAVSSLPPIQTYLAIDTTTFSLYTAPFFSISTEGVNTIKYYSVDSAGDTEVTHSTQVAVDLTPPITTLSAVGVNTYTNSQGTLIVSTDTVFSLSSVDPISNGVASGVDMIYYVINQDPASDACFNTPFDPTQPPGTCANPDYAGSFSLSAGTYTAYVFADDNVGNQELENVQTIVVAAPSTLAVSPSTGPIGIPFTITGSGFGTYNDGNTRVRFGTILSPLSVWNDTTISGNVPGLSTGTYPVFIEVQTGASIADTGAGLFTVFLPSVTALSPPSGPIGTPFTLSGAQFGPYNNAGTIVLIGGQSAPLSLWNDTAIMGTVPNLGAGAQPVVVERTTPDGGLATSATFYFNVTVPTAAPIAPSTGPIGIPFTISGSGFGTYNNANTRVLIGGTTAPLNTWNNTTIMGTIPGLSTGTYAVSVVIQAGSGLTISTAGFFTVITPTLSSISPPSGPIGVSFTLTGSGFGPYNNSATVVLMGGTTAALSVWNDTTITGSVPGNLSPGSYPVIVVRTTPDGGMVQTSSATFAVTAFGGATMTPSTGPIGIPFTISGTGFGTYNNSNTRIRFGPLLAPLNVWNNTTISGNVPGLSTGTYCVKIEIQSGSNVDVSTVAQFTVFLPSATALSPPSGPIGSPFTLTGSYFGTYNNAATTVLIGGTPAPLNTWNDTTIAGTIPNVSSGTQSVLIVRTTPDGGMATGATFYFNVTIPAIASITPSSGPIGVNFTLTGTSFGSYNNNATVVLMGGTTAALSVWNDTAITGSVPGNLAPGGYPVIVVRTTPDGGYVQSASATFTVTGLSAVSLTPSIGPIGIPFTISGNGFGTYNNANTRVLIGGATVPLNTWNNTTIAGAIPGLSTGTYCVQVVIQAGSNITISTAGYFTVITPALTSITPGSGPIGVAFTLTGAGFGPYNNAATAVLFGATTAQLSVWNDTTIMGSVPGISSGTYAVVVERTTPDGGLMISSSATFTIAKASIASIIPSTGPIGIPFTLSGSGFGAYDNGNTRVRIGHQTAPLSSWTDSSIQGTIPGLSVGTYTVVVEIQSGSDVSYSTVGPFGVIAPTAAAIAPTSGTPGTSFTITGAGFGPYNNGNTQVLFSTIAAALSAWTDTMIQGTVPNVAFGTNTVAVSIQAGSAVVTSTVAFDVVAPNYVFNSTDGVVTLNSANASETVTPIAPPSQSNAYAIATSTEENEVVGSFYELSPSGNVFNPPATIQFSFDPANTDTATLTIYTFNGVAWDSSSIVNQQITILSPTQGVITGTLYHASLYGAIHRHRRLRVGIISPKGPGFAGQIKGTIPVLGYATGLSLADWTLDFAPGQDARSGFTTIASGASAVSTGTLASWNAAGLSGWQTLRLSAKSVHGKSASVSENVYVGDPSLLSHLDQNLKGPTGVAVGRSGLTYVADTGNDRIDVFSSLGTLTASFPATTGPQPFSLRAPEGVATDFFGNIYVADTGGRRALKLTSLGTVSLSIPLHGKPVGIAVDAAGYIYVSDQSDAAVLKFDAAGSKLLTFALPQSKPAGIALDGAGNLYVVDPKKRRLAVFNSSGTLVNTFGPGLALDRPYGVAVTPSGTTIVVSDMASDRVESLDALGRARAAFGGPRSGLSGPRGLAFDAQGDLYLAERPLNKILKLGPPIPGMAPVPFANPLALLGQDDAYVAAAAGGRLQRPDGASLTIPPGALADDMDCSISTPAVRLQAEEDLKNRKLANDNLIAVSTGAVFGPEGTALATFAELCVPYDAAAVAALGVPELRLKIYGWNPNKQDWFWIPARAEPAKRVVCGRALSLGLYRVMMRKDGL
jgi:sugar lactone lactonase YvrE